MTQTTFTMSCHKCHGTEIGWYHEKGNDYLFMACIPCENAKPEEKQAVRWYEVQM